MLGEFGANPKFLTAHEGWREAFWEHFEKIF